MRKYNNIYLALIIIFCLFLCFIIICFNINTDDSSLKEDGDIIQYEETSSSNNEIFGDYYASATELIGNMTLDEKIGQLFLVRYPNKNQIDLLKKYHFGGYIFFEKDFSGKKEEDVINEIKKLQEASKIPILTAVDEEGGSIVRISRNKNLVKEQFKSPMELYKTGGFESIAEDTKEKSEVLGNLGINLNLAPVVDISTNPDDYIYKRTLGEGKELTSVFAETVITESKGTNVSCTLKHFPGYSSNMDTHKGSSVDSRTYEYIVENDLPPFKAGIDAGAEAIMVSHNIVTSIDENNPASLSPKVHEILRNELGFTGVIITDDLFMEAVAKDENATVKAILAGNDIMIVTDYEKSISSVKQAIEDKIVDEKMIDELVLRVLSWKFYKGLIQ